MNNRSGTSMVETMVVLAIIGMMLAIAVPHYTKAIRLAKDVAADEALRQKNLVPDITTFDCSSIDQGLVGDDYDRACARLAYRQIYDGGKFDFFVTEMLYEVNSDAEFKAYWHTLIGPDESILLEYTVDGSLIVYDAYGEQFILPPITRNIEAGGTARVLGWEFLSTNMGHMNSTKMGTRVLYSDGARVSVRYPEPISTRAGSLSTQLIAELSNRYMTEVYQG